MDLRTLGRRATGLCCGLAGLSLLTLSGCNQWREADGYDIPDHYAEQGDPCVEDLNCVESTVCYENTCVGEGALRVSLSFASRTDADLHVRLPDGTEIAWDNPNHSTGELDVDDCVLVCRTWDGPHVENVFFNESAYTGLYEVWVENFDGRRSTSFQVDVFAEGNEVASWSGNLPSQAGATSSVWTFDYE